MVKIRSGRGTRLRESLAMLRQARLLLRDRGLTVDEGSGPTVLLLHGLYASAGVWTPLRAVLKGRLRATTVTFSYAPGVGIDDLASRVSEVIPSLLSTAPIFLVGHSLGGLALRRYAAAPRCDERVVRTVSLAAPFRGTHRNWLAPGQAGKDIRPQAPILKEISQPTPENLRVPHLSLIAEEDEVVLHGAAPEFGQREHVFGVGHNGILFSEIAIERVVREVGEYFRTSRTLDGER